MFHYMGRIALARWLTISHSCWLVSGLKTLENRILSAVLDKKLKEVKGPQIPGGTFNVSSYPQNFRREKWSQSWTFGYADGTGNHLDFWTIA